jgi:hypothetical protein
VSVVYAILYRLLSLTLLGDDKVDGHVQGYWSKYGSANNVAGANYGELAVKMHESSGAGLLT